MTDSPDILDPEQVWPKPKTYVCEKCRERGPMVYWVRGQRMCPACGHAELDAFKALLQQRMPWRNA